MSIAENEKTWVAYCDDSAYGPLSALEIKQALLDEKLKDDDCVWKKGWSKWKQLKDIPIYSFESKKSPGSGRPIPDIAVPDPKEFESVISPKVSTKELDTSNNWDARRIAIVGGALCLGGVPSAAIAGVLTSKNKDKKQAELDKNEKYIAPKNR